MMIAWLRNPPSTVDTPFGRHPIKRMYGLSHRGWFFGLQIVGKPRQDKAAAEPFQTAAHYRMKVNTEELEREAHARSDEFFREKELVRVVDTGEPEFVPLSVAAGDTSVIGARTYTALSTYEAKDGQRMVNCSFDTPTHHGDTTISEAEFQKGQLI